MDILLSKREQVLLKLLEELTQAQDWIQLSDWAEKLNLSLEELHDCLSTLEALSPNLLIYSTKSSIKLECELGNCLDPRITIFKNSPNISFLNYLFFNEGSSLTTAREALSTSQEQVENIVRYLNTILPKNYAISIQTSPIEILGKEEDIRSFYLDYFSQSYAFLDWPFPSISEDILTSFIQTFLDSQQVSPNLLNLRQIKYTVAINMVRLKKNHVISNPTPLLTNHYHSILQAPKFEYDIKKLAKKLRFEPTKSSLEQLFSNPTNTPQISKNPCNNPLGDINYIQKSYRLLSQIVTELSKEFHLQIDEKEELIWLLHYTAQDEFLDKTSNHFLDKKKSRILTKYEEEFPKLFEESRRKFLDYLIEMGLEYQPKKVEDLLYTFSVQGHRILVQLLKKLPKIRVLVISDLDSCHAQSLIASLSFYGSNLYLFDIWEKTGLSLKKLNQTPHDIIITNFPVSNSSKPIICSQNLSTTELFHRLHLLSSQIQKSRLT